MFKTRYSLKLKNELYCKVKPNLVKIPNLMVCTDSMHSKHKVQEKYPSVNETVIQQLYGLHTTDAQRRMWKVRKSIPDLFDLLRGTYEKEYTKLNAINLTQFYIDTTPVYYMFHCGMTDINCRMHWKIRRTSFGSCLQLDTNNVYKAELAKKRKLPERAQLCTSKACNISELNGSVGDILASFDQFPKPSEIKELDFIVGFNKSDKTFGLNGFDNALKLYFADNDETFMTKSQSIDLVPGLNPTITFSRSVTKLLGEPFTGCSHTKDYTERTCQVHEYMTEVLDKCGCYPR